LTRVRWEPFEGKGAMSDKLGFVGANVKLARLLSDERFGEIFVVGCSGVDFESDIGKGSSNNGEVGGEVDLRHVVHWL
jgi:hypothetical protein